MISPEKWLRTGVIVHFVVVVMFSSEIWAYNYFSPTEGFGWAFLTFMIFVAFIAMLVGVGLSEMLRRGIYPDVAAALAGVLGFAVLVASRFEGMIPLTMIGVVTVYLRIKQRDERVINPMN